MTRLDKAVRRETGYIAIWVLILSALMQAIFLVLHKWNYTVLLGNLLSGGVSVLNFLLMGVTIQSATGKDEARAKQQMHFSHALRLLMVFAATVLGVLLPCFNTISSIAPIFFPRLALAFQPLFLKDDGSAGKRPGSEEARNGDPQA